MWFFLCVYLVVVCDMLVLLIVVWCGCCECVVGDVGDFEYVLCFVCVLGGVCVCGGVGVY